MCGILGGINIDIEKIDPAKTRLQHRGPDENGDFKYKNLYLYHARLSIQDIASGQQPFHSNGYTIIFNGEIYNHLELRKTYNLNCKTNSDTETLLLLFQKLNDKVLDLLDGMFAFAIFNIHNNQLFIARDRAGEKPLYIYHSGNQISFCSELNALTSIFKPELNYENFNQYLRYSFLSSHTPYQNIFELEAGSWIQIDIETLAYKKIKWWKIDNFYQKCSPLNFNDAKDKVDKLLQESIYDRLNTSDLEVGTFLSGGIDSGLVTAIASKYKPDIKTFTVAFTGQYDESSLAELVVKKYKTNHKKINISFTDLKNDLEKILVNYGEPFSDSSAIPSYYVSKEAKKHLTVILNGDGADELFGGYRRYVPFSKFDFFSTNFVVKGIPSVINAILPHPGNKQSKYNYFYRLMDLARKDSLHSYLSATVDSFEGFENKFYTKLNPFIEIRNNIQSREFKNLTGLKKIMCLDFNYLFANDLLVKMDIATMAHSLEGRTPFLSKELLEFVPSLKDSYKINGVTTKYILRELAKKYLPKELIYQPKRGFEVPLRSWIENELKEITFDYLSGNTFSENFVKKIFITNLLENKIKVSPEKRAKMLWTMLAMEIWYRKIYLI
jgi:asparagine synthase (glutamine-hydrolysing)